MVSTDFNLMSIDYAQLELRVLTLMQTPNKVTCNSCKGVGYSVSPNWFVTGQVDIIWCTTCAGKGYQN